MPRSSAFFNGIEGNARKAMVGISRDQGSQLSLGFSARDAPSVTGRFEGSLGGQGRSFVRVKANLAAYRARRFSPRAPPSQSIHRSGLRRGALACDVGALGCGEIRDVIDGVGVGGTLFAPVLAVKILPAHNPIRVQMTFAHCRHNIRYVIASQCYELLFRPVGWGGGWRCYLGTSIF
jgi:hypothetical protein